MTRGIKSAGIFFFGDADNVAYFQVFAENIDSSPHEQPKLLYNSPFIHDASTLQ